MTSVADLLSTIESSRPPGYFAAARPLLDEYIRLRVEIDGLWPCLHRTRPGTAQSTMLTLALCSKTKAALDLAETLNLLDRGLPPPRLE
jgi:hypothetical protein